MTTTLTLRRLLLTSAAIIALICILGAHRQAATILAQTTALTDQMPVDPQITIGKFPNGLQYYIRANKKPEKRAELRLVVKAGSVLEDDDQPARIWDLPQLYKKLDAATIQKAAKTYLNTNAYLRAMLFPEKK